MPGIRLKSPVPLDIPTRLVLPAPIPRFGEPRLLGATKSPILTLKEDKIEGKQFKLLIHFDRLLIKLKMENQQRKHFEI